MDIPQGWNHKGDAINRRFEFDTYAAALAFVNAASALAEQANHHPEVSFGWGYAEITLTSHDAGKVTEKDTDLANLINNLR